MTNTSAKIRTWDLPVEAVCDVHSTTEACKKCGTMKQYRKGKMRCKACLYRSQMVRWNRTKTILVNYKGAVCQVCGRSGHPSIFDFHHIDPHQKEFTVSRRRGLNIGQLKSEVDKCLLICACCHRLQHVNEDLWLFDHNDPKPKVVRDTKPCPICGTDMPPTNRTCSTRCARASRQVVDWPINLPELVSQSSMRAVARQLGVSDHAVAKRLKHHH